MRLEHMHVQRITVGQQLRQTFLRLRSGDEGRLAQITIDQQHAIAQARKVLRESQGRARLTFGSARAGDEQGLRHAAIGRELERRP